MLSWVFNVTNSGIDDPSHVPFSTKTKENWSFEDNVSEMESLSLKNAALASTPEKDSECPFETETT